MKKTVILVIMACLLVSAGCTTPSSDPGVTGTVTALPVLTAPLTQGQPLPMDAHVTHTTPNTTFEVWVDSFEVGGIEEDGNQELTIYVAAKNTGTKPIQMVWFSKMTDLNGKTYGGIGVSKGGVGARTDWIQPNMTEMARDFVIIRSDRDLAALKNGAVLDVYFIERPTNEYPASLEPDYHTQWTIDAGAIR